jgi:hypothetical protein
MEWFWNIIHYSIYKMDYKFHLLFSKINPFTLIHKLPFQKRLYEKKGINIRNEINEAFKRPDYGISIIRAGGFMYVLFLLISFASINMLSAILQKEFDLKLYHFFILIVLTIIVNHFLLFKRNKYRAYFNEFEKMTQKEKKKWAWISFLVIAGILLYSIGSFVFLDYRL